MLKQFFYHQINLGELPALSETSPTPSLLHPVPLGFRGETLPHTDLPWRHRPSAFQDYDPLYAKKCISKPTAQILWQRDLGIYK